MPRSREAEGKNRRRRKGRSAKPKREGKPAPTRADDVRAGRARSLFNCWLCRYIFCNRIGRVQRAQINKRSRNRTFTSSEHRRVTSVCRAPPTLAVSVRASCPHRLGDGSNLGPCPRIRGPFQGQTLHFRPIFLAQISNVNFKRGRHDGRLIAFAAVAADEGCRRGLLHACCRKLTDINFRELHF